MHCTTFFLSLIAFHDAIRLTCAVARFRAYIVQNDKWLRTQKCLARSHCVLVCLFIEWMCDWVRAYTDARTRNTTQHKQDHILLKLDFTFHSAFIVSFNLLSFIRCTIHQAHWCAHAHTMVWLLVSVQCSLFTVQMHHRKSHNLWIKLWLKW